MNHDQAMDQASRQGINWKNVSHWYVDGDTLVIVQKHQTERTANVGWG